MPLLETLMVDVGGSIAKALLTRWLGSNSIVSDATSSVADVLKGSITDRLAQQRARHQFEAIGEKVGESLFPLFETEGAALDEESRTAIAMAVAETLNTASSALLAKHNLEPVEIACQLLKDHPAHSYHFSSTEEHLYEQIISESCQYIVDIASQLPRFNERMLAEILGRERQLINIAENIVQEVTRLREQQDPQRVAARFELDYRRAVIRKLDELELFGSGMSVTARKYSLSLAYVALSLEHDVVKPLQEYEERSHLTIPDSSRKSRVVREVTGLLQVLAESPYLLLRGDAGSGKTTLMQWIAVQSALQCFPQELAPWNGTVPFLIRLRQHIHVGENCEPRWPVPEDFPGLVAPIIAGSMPQGWVHQQLQEGHAIVLVDGIDEVPIPLRESIYVWLGDLIASYPLARFVVTARPYAANKDDLPARERLKEAQVLPMSPSATEEFITQWHRAIEANLQDLQDLQDLQESANYLIAGIRSSRALQQLATNPLLCAMLCVLNRERHQHLPSNRIALYEACCELLIERRDQERRISLLDYPAATLSYEQKSLLLSDLAYWMVRNGQTEVPDDTVDEWMTRHLSRMVGVPNGLKGTDARLLFMERSGILREPMSGAVDFTHRTFQEFLAAKAIVDENDIPLLVEHAHDDQWREVVLLTVGLASRKVRENLVERLLKRGEVRKRIRAQLYLLAAACTQSVHEEMNMGIQSRIDRGLATLIPLKSVGQVEAMAAAGTFAVPYLAPRFEYSPSVAAACVRALLRIGNESAFNILEKYTSDNTADVIDALIQGLREVGDKSVYSQRFLSHIKHLSISIETFQFLPFILELNSLAFWEFPKESDLSILERLPKLTSLEFHILPEEHDLSILERLPKLTSLVLHELSNVSDLSILERLPKLTSLGLMDLPNVSDLSVLELLPELSSLVLMDLPKVSDLSVLEKLPRLTSLALYNPTTVSMLKQLRGLTSLTLYNLLEGDLSVLESLPKLTSLALMDLPKMSDLSALEKLPGLTALRLYDLPEMSDLSALEKLPGLTALRLRDLPEVSDLSALEKLPKLTSLALYNLPKVSNLAVLEQLPNLTSLDVWNLPKVSDLAVLERLPRLTSLELRNLPKVSDLSSLTSLESLKSISIGRMAARCVFPEHVLARVIIQRFR
ncbi:NACHT domain-containing protein [Dictyobacter aurantiacus]|uniref:ATP-binding protein n=1 Tax=Dictyobacter aurantiacus TaxID=1936993 RepID=A0A401ZGW8_9CHLR|nr:NACHT domain-containing protein [Dictyobacter aurantiacus]GCE06130.1 ATP-binding protein [Dictyobacter aurantiacus]